MAGSDRLNHCCMKCVRSMVINEKGGPASLAFGVVRRNQFDQRRPRHHLVHLVQEHLLAGFLRAEVEGQGGLFHDLYFLK